MLEGINLRKLKRFVLSRQNDDGGFAFCNPLPSSLPETFYAISILKDIGERIPKRDRLVRFLKANLCEEPYSIFWVFNSLSLLGEELPDMRNFLLEKINNVILNTESRYLISERGITATYSFEMPNLLRRIYILAVPLRLLGLDVPADVKKFLRKFRKNGGYGINNPNLQETFYCILTLGEDVEDKRGVIDFIMQHECNSGGFSSSPKSYPPYIEETYYAISCFKSLNYRYFNSKTISYLISLQNPDGGFRRSIYLGISTLEDTYYGISSLKYFE